MNTTENNRLLAEFLGWEKILTYLNIGEKKEEFFTTPFFKEYYNTGTSIDREGWDTTHLFRPYELLFNTSWDWLMLVVEKIRGLEVVENFNINVTNDVIIEGLFPTIQTDCTNKIGTIEATYNACIEFVKWRNEQLKK